MSQQLLQIKVEPSLKEKLQRIAISKGLNMTSYIKMTLLEVSQKDADLALTDNGFTVREERRLLKSIREGEAAYRSNTMKRYVSMKAALQSLDE